MVWDRQALEAGLRSEPIRAVARQLAAGAETLENWCNRCGAGGTMRWIDIAAIRAASKQYCPILP